jgi:hypothetical protein
LPDPISTGKSRTLWYTPVIPETAESTNRRIAVQASPGKKQDPISKIIRVKRVGSVENSKMAARGRKQKATLL